MAKYSLDTLTSVFLTKNIRKQQDNLPESRRTLVPHADAISLYQAIKDILEYLQITSTGVTNLGVTQTTTTVTVTSSSGDDGTIPSATTLLAGAMSADDKTNLQALITLSGLTAGSTNFGTFTGTIIDDNSTLKNILQQLELAIAASVAGGIYGGSGTIAPNAVATLTPNSVFQIEFDGGGTALHISDLNEIVTISSPDGFYSLGTTPTQLLLTGPSGDLSFNATNTVYTDTLSGQGIQYAADYSATFQPNSLITKSYADSLAAGLPAGAGPGAMLAYTGGS